MNDTYNRIFHKYNHYEILIKDDIDKLIFSTVLKRKKKSKKKNSLHLPCGKILKKKIKEKELIPYFWSTLQGHPYNTITSYVFLGFQVILAEQLPRPFV